MCKIKYIVLIIKHIGGNNHAKSETIKKRLIEIEEKKKISGSRKDKNIQKYSEKFNEIFVFFLKSYRSDILTFCGSDVKVDFDKNSDSGKLSFRKFENGEIKINDLKSKHSNILKGVIIGKKSWGLWLNQWVDGIIEGSFVENEIFEEFYKKGIKIPESLMTDFQNTLLKRKIKRNEVEIERLKILWVGGPSG